MFLCLVVFASASCAFQLQQPGVDEINSVKENRRTEGPKKIDEHQRILNRTTENKELLKLAIGLLF